MVREFDFSERMEQSAVKTEIVSKYFDAWANVMLSIPSVNNIAYIDLCSGPGRYEEDNVDSTPLVILRKIIETPKLAEKTLCIFNDENEHYCCLLKKNIASLKGIDRLAHIPSVNNVKITEKTAEQFMDKKIPCFSFIDPAGYDALSLDLLYSLTKDFGADVIFFFNYNEINRWITVDIHKNNMINIFGKECYDYLKDSLPHKSPEIREELIIKCLKESLNEIGLGFVLPFKFTFEGMQKTSHYIVFASKYVKGFNIMKEVLSKKCTIGTDGIREFKYTHNAHRSTGYQLSILGIIQSPFDEFKERLCFEFKGRTIKMEDVFNEDTIYSPYIAKEYKKALMELEQEGKVKCDRPASARKKGTMADHTVVSFLQGPS